MANWEAVEEGIEQKQSEKEKRKEEEEEQDQYRIDHLNRGIQHGSWISLLIYGISQYCKYKSEKKD